jgi:hypothetical protein
LFLSSRIGIIEGFSTRDIIASEEIIFCYSAGLKISNQTWPSLASRTGVYIPMDITLSYWKGVLIT